jgi:hypothetical protein
MAKKSKGFAELLKLQNKSQSLPQIKIKAPIVQATNSPMSSNLDEQEARVGEILGLDSDGEIPDVNRNTLIIYRDYLQQELQFPCIVTGIEDFQWEEYYIIGGGSKKEHNELRKTRPSYLDTYQFLEFTKEIDEFYGLQVLMKRVSDNRRFILNLADLKSTDEDSKNYQLLDDYSVWFVNWR